MYRKNGIGYNIYLNDAFGLRARSIPDISRVMCEYQKKKKKSVETGRDGNTTASCKRLHRPSSREEKDANVKKDKDDGEKKKQQKTNTKRGCKRRRMSKKTVQSSRDEEVKAVERMQGVVRGRLARAKTMQTRRDEEVKAVERIQGVVQGRLARIKTVQSRRDEEVKAVERIQGVVRGASLRMNYRKKFVNNFFHVWQPDPEVIITDFQKEIRKQIEIFNSI